MVHSGAERDYRTVRDSGLATEVTKDSNEVDQVLLATPEGATVQVRS
jgi:hypothetical protein